ncbi:MAG: BrnT family toxin [Planctomycetes bacterium]|nr:BrnT family toxin [Planctomycetota bacterium]
MKVLRPVPASRAILEKIEEKYGVSFEEMEALFQRPHLVLRGSVDPYGERRYASLGQDSAGRFLLVYVVPEPCVARVITAREMTARERGSFRRKFRGRKK